MRKVWQCVQTTWCGQIQLLVQQPAVAAMVPYPWSSELRKQQMAGMPIMCATSVVSWDTLLAFVTTKQLFRQHQVRKVVAAEVALTVAAEVEVEDAAVSSTHSPQTRGGMWGAGQPYVPGVG
jgi:hypothetical protein